MHKIEIPESNKTIELPSHWDELTPDQMHKVMHLAYEVVTGQQSIADFQLTLFVYFTGLKITPSFRYRHQNGTANHITESLYRLSEQLCNWPFQITTHESRITDHESRITDHGTKHYELKYTSVENPFPKLKIKSDILIGPATILSDLTFSEFRTALDHLGDYGKLTAAQEYTEAEESLNLFLACLYREQQSNSKKRVAFNRDELYTTAATLAKLPNYIKQGIVLWFTFCVDYLQQYDLIIEGAEVNFSVLFPKPTEGTQPQPGLGWSGLLYDIAESGIFGDIDAADQKPLFQVLLFLYKKHIDNLKLKRHAKN